MLIKKIHIYNGQSVQAFSLQRPITPLSVKIFNPPLTESHTWMSRHLRLKNWVDMLGFHTN